MIIDLHTQIWLNLDQLGSEIADRLRTRQMEHWGQLDASPAAHERAMGCVDGAFVIGFRSDRLGAHVPNEYIADYVAKDPRRRIGIAGIDPLSEDAMDQFDTKRHQHVEKLLGHMFEMKKIAGKEDWQKVSDIDKTLYESWQRSFES